MNVLTLEKSKERLTRALLSWQLGAIGLTARGLPAGPGIVAADTGVSREAPPCGAFNAKPARGGPTGKHVDIAVSTHEQTVEFGVRPEKVWISGGP